jgi:hypothetical protein
MLGVEILSIPFSQERYHRTQVSIWPVTAICDVGAIYCWIIRNRIVTSSEVRRPFWYTGWWQEHYPCSL